MLLKRVNTFNMSISDLHDFFTSQKTTICILPDIETTYLVCKIKDNNTLYSSIVDTIRVELPKDFNPWNKYGVHMLIHSNSKLNMVILS